MINYCEIFVVAPCVLIGLSSLFVQIMHTEYYKIVKELKSFKIIKVAPTCFGLHKPASGSFREAQAESSLMLVYVNRNMLEQLL